MLFDSSIRRELARSFGATLVVLVTVVMTMMLIRTLGQASRGSVNPSDVMLVMGFTVLGQLPIILSLSLFVAVVGVLSRMYRDSEMVIWFSSGQGLMSLLRPLLRFAWPVMAVIAILSLGVWPWANAQIQELKTRYEQRSDIDRIAPGEFQESANGSRVFFIDKDSPDTQAGNNIFIAASSGAAPEQHQQCCMTAWSSFCGSTWPSDTAISLVPPVEQKAPHNSCSAGALAADADNGIASRLNSTARQAIQARAGRCAGMG